MARFTPPRSPWVMGWLEAIVMAATVVGMVVWGIE
jgi:hypothetical protein